MPGVEDEVDTLEGLHHLGRRLRARRRDVGVGDEADLQSIAAVAHRPTPHVLRARRARAPQRLRGPTRTRTRPARRAAGRGPGRRCGGTWSASKRDRMSGSMCFAATKSTLTSRASQSALLRRGEAVGATADEEAELLRSSHHLDGDPAGWVAELHGAVDIEADEIMPSRPPAFSSDVRRPCSGSKPSRRDGAPDQRVAEVRHVRAGDAVSRPAS